MSRIITDKKQLISILGLPRQGTTLISGIFNSFDNSFCAVEPHWAKIANRGQAMNSGNKIPNRMMYDNTVDQFVPILRNYLDSYDSFKIGAIKETYRSHQKESCKYLLNSDLLDIHLFIFREPKAGFNAWKRVKWGGYYDDVNYYNKCYLDLWNEGDLLLKENKKIVRIKYEELCNGNANEYLNNKFSPYEIEFPSVISEIKQIGSIFGDPSASRGGKINNSNDEYELLTSDEIKNVEILFDRFYSVI